MHISTKRATELRRRAFVTLLLSFSVRERPFLKTECLNISSSNKEKGTHRVLFSCLFIQKKRIRVKRLDGRCFFRAVFERIKTKTAAGKERGRAFFIRAGDQNTFLVGCIHSEKKGKRRDIGGSVRVGEHGVLAKGACARNFVLAFHCISSFAFLAYSLAQFFCFVNRNA